MCVNDILFCLNGEMETRFLCFVDCGNARKFLCKFKHVERLQLSTLPNNWTDAAIGVFAWIGKLLDIEIIII